MASAATPENEIGELERLRAETKRLKKALKKTYKSRQCLAALDAVSGWGLFACPHCEKIGEGERLPCKRAMCHGHCQDCKGEGDCAGWEACRKCGHQSETQFMTCVQTKESSEGFDVDYKPATHFVCAGCAATKECFCSDPWESCVKILADSHTDTTTCSGCKGTITVVRKAIMPAIAEKTSESRKRARTTE